MKNKKQKSPDSIRSFIALQPDEKAREQIAHAQSEFRVFPSQVKWEAVRNFHITLKFLGDTSADVLQKIEMLLRSQSLPEQFSAMIDTAGCFPRISNPRIIWTGFSNAPSVVYEIGKICEDISYSCGFERENKKFHPHFTIGRVKGTPGISDLQNPLKTITFDPFVVHFNAISIMKSVLQPTGSIYSELSAIPLLMKK